MSNCDDSKTMILELSEVLTTQECTDLIQKIEDLSPTMAPVNTGKGAVVKPHIRNNERVIFDDVELAKKLFDVAKEFLPQEFDGRTISGANERFRCYRYKPGMKFAPHADGSFVRDEFECSYYSYLVYLNDGFDGGETTFFTRPEVAIKPVAGDALLFQHPIIHEGSIVNKGVKYVVRTDVMYRD